MIPGFAAQGIHRIHCVRPRPHLMTGTYPTSVKHRAYTPRAWRAKSVKPPSSRSVSAMLNACRVSPGHEVRPWSYHTVDSVYSLRGKAGNHFQLLVIELLSGSRGLVVLSPAWKTTRSEFDSQ